MKIMNESTAISFHLQWLAKRPKQSSYAFAKIIWILLGFLLLAISAAPEISGDATGRYADAVWLSLLQYPIATKFSSVQGFLSAPLFLLGNWLRLDTSLVPFFNLAIFGLLISSLAVLLEPKRRFIVLLLLMATTMFPHHLQHFYGEVLTASLCTLGVFCIFKNRWVLATVCIGVGGSANASLNSSPGCDFTFFKHKAQKLSISRVPDTTCQHHVF